MLPDQPCTNCAMKEAAQLREHTEGMSRAPSHHMSGTATAKAESAQSDLRVLHAAQRQRLVVLKTVAELSANMALLMDHAC